MGTSRRRGWRIGFPVAVAVFGVIMMAPTGGTVLALRSGGVAVGEDGAVAVIPPGVDAGFVPGTSVPMFADVTNPTVAARIEDDRAWLRSGDVPGQATEYVDMAERALLDLRVLTSETGALMAAPVTSWKYAWPRDSSFAVAAFAVTGHHEEARDVLSFLAEVAPIDGRWEARYRLDGSGPPDDRPEQLDGAGWVTWAVWMFVSTAPDDDLVAEVIAMMAPAVIASADAIVEAIGADGVPEPSPDYWEKHESEPTLGVVAPMSLGLRAAISLAPALGVDPMRWVTASTQLNRAIEDFAAHDYPRTVPDGGADAAVAFLAPPFAIRTDEVAEAVRETERVLRVPNGGHRPGEAWTKDVGVAWTPETALLALALVGGGDEDEAERLLTFLNDYRTPMGSLPEKIDVEPKPASVAPLAWTSSLVVLTLAQLEEGLPVVPSL